jgi:hypothetical protein
LFYDRSVNGNGKKQEKRQKRGPERKGDIETAISGNPRVRE